ncbi:hypothetical protein D9M68_1004790 [compost metagenome]
MHDAATRVPVWNQLNQASCRQVLTHRHPRQVCNPHSGYHEVAQGKQVISHHAWCMRDDDAAAVVLTLEQFPLVLALGTAPMHAG